MKKGGGAAVCRRWALSRLGLLVGSLALAATVLLNLEAVLPSLFSYYSWQGEPEPSSSRSPEAAAAIREQEQQATAATRLLPGRLVQDELFWCDRSHPRTDVCYLKGDVRMRDGSFVLQARNASTGLGSQTVKPYTRKWEKECMDLVHPVTVRSVPGGGTAEGCDVEHRVPAVVFTTGGYTGNLYHEFHDGLIPLYITSQHLHRRLVLVGVELHQWWLTKYGDVVSQLTGSPVIDFDRDNRTHCFPEVTVGLHIHDELAVEPSLMPNNESIQDFRRLLDAAYSSPPPPPGGEEEALSLPPARGGGEESGGGERRRPRLVVLLRNETRVILNLEAVVAAAEEVGFEVRLFSPGRYSELRKAYWALNASQALLGVHGAALTHFLFMRPGSVFVQIVPLGTTWAADAYYGLPARRLGLRYLRYEVTPAESTLSDKYAANDTVLTQPELVNERGGWQALKSVYLEGQDVRPSPQRLKKYLRRAYIHAMAKMQEQPQVPVSTSR